MIPPLQTVSLLSFRFARISSNQLNCLLLVSYVLVVAYSILINVGPLVLALLPSDQWCGLHDQASDHQTASSTNNGGRRLSSGDFYIEEAVSEEDSPYANPDYITDPCRYLRVPQLSYITLEECDMCRRLLCSVLLGGVIGYERRSADRPAGIRIMGLVSLGACSFTISSIMAFKTSTMGWDASRVAAALPSGVGFLGGALIWKGSVFLEGEEVHQVHGLTTAASLWLSAAVGVGCGGALYLVTAYVVIMVIMILRYAPRSYSALKALDDEEEGEDEDYDDFDNAGDDEECNKDEAMDKVPSMRTEAASANISAASISNMGMVSSKSSNSLVERRGSATNNLRRNRSVRDLVPTFAE